MQPSAYDAAYRQARLDGHDEETAGRLARLSAEQQPAPSAAHQPSPYQQAIYDWIAHGSGDAVINAVAGSGKTTTIIHAASLARGRRVFLAFNRSIAQELGRRLPADVAAATLHSVGFAAIRNSGMVRKPRVDDYKLRDIIRDALIEAYPDARHDRDAREAARDAESALLQLADKVRLNLVEPTDRNAVADLAWRYGIVTEPTVLDLLPRVLRRSESAAERGQIDFVDMLYLPARWRLSPPPADWIFIDEAQDLSPAGLALVLSMRAPGGRLVAVGDRHQAIYGFAGADPESMDRIIAATGATELPLSVCYRCPRTHLDLARALVPHIEARPDAPDGQVHAIAESQLAESVGNGDLILCRLTAPLISQCISLIAARKPARVRGRDVAAQLIKTAKDALQDRPWADWHDALADYDARQRAKLARRRDAETAIQSHEDRLAGLAAIVDAYQPASLDALATAIGSLFADDAASIWLSTVHRAKGLEAARVFILRPEKMPLVWPGQQAWEATQERNIQYVALTRATEALTYVVKDLPTQPDAAHLAPELVTAR